MKYHTTITNVDTGNSIESGDSIPIGTRIRLDFEKHKYTDISWFGTGYSGDSPYGEWREEGAGPPTADTCKNKDFVTNYTIGQVNVTFGVYIPLVVDSPNKSFSNLTGLTNCVTKDATEINGISMICTVSSAGILKPTFNFSSTTGKFYYRYKSGSECIGNNVPLKTANKVDFFYYGFWIAPENLNAYSLEVPEKTITYTLNAFAPPTTNRAPNPPNITGPTVGYIGTGYTF